MSKLLALPSDFLPSVIVPPDLIKILDSAIPPTDFGGEANLPAFPDMPLCSHGLNVTGKCWARQVTQWGLCYTSSLGDAPNALIQGIGPKHAATYLMFDNVEYSGRKQYDVYVTPPGHFAFGKYDHGYGQPAEPTAGFNTDDDNANRFLTLWLKITRVTTTTDAFRAMSPNVRGCYYADEVDLTPIFPNYSQSNCILNCTFAVAEETCHCVPWYLKQFFEGSKACEIFGNECFRGAVENRHEIVGNECIESCLPDCETREYQVFNQPEKTILEDIDDKDPEFTCSQIPKEQRFPDLNLVCQFLKEMKERETDIPEKIRQSPASQLDTLRALRLAIWHRGVEHRILKTATVTAVDVISNIGGSGTLGLFLGCSVLSLLEVIYWIVVGLGSAFTKKKKT